ncbi:YqaE/Pmp3 family membrane protein [Sphingomonas sp. G-3-2-10]|uniref:YqaE/Pmp3 family membrane protein n=1 Tax=Sphingomonas sp. G-3-2-10 TaxID=2728838 RepID=UPI00146D5CFD|nr:YqaE/Pmp3 family membrane protein [Sphingomonas sp. G-3-2-10]NML07054.1 YqaE/Pmp3 family membrane protein [Sphingomonas sp. G-3-2-10]
MNASPGRIAAAALAPPLGVYLARGGDGAFLIACGLTVLGFVPGMVYALWTVLDGRRLLPA